MTDTDIPIIDDLDDELVLLKSILMQFSFPQILGDADRLAVLDRALSRHYEIGFARSAAQFFQNRLFELNEQAEEEASQEAAGRSN
jgi:hypothetical protein